MRRFWWARGAVVLAAVLVSFVALPVDAADTARTGFPPLPVPTIPIPPPTTTPPTTPPPTTPPTETRQAWLWPFSADSPWNVGVGTGARYEAGTATRTASLIRTDVQAWVNADQYSHPIYRASNADPMATVRRKGHPDEHYRIPNDAVPAAGSDHHLHIVDPTDRWVDESWLMQGRNPSWTTGYHVRVDLQSSGVGAGGVRAYGGSAIAGLVRQWELDKGQIRHALAIAITAKQLARGPVWPATSEDGDARWSYKGAVPMGTYAAIPPDVDLRTLGLTPEGLALGLALQRYGAYIVDRSSVFTFYAEPSVHGAQLNHLRADAARLRAVLRVVMNNSSSSVNGGGARRVTPAPGFAG